MGQLKKLKKKIKNNMEFGLSRLSEKSREFKEDVMASTQIMDEELEQLSIKPKKPTERKQIGGLTELQYLYLDVKMLMVEFEERLTENPTKAIAWVDEVFAKAGIRPFLTPEEYAAERHKRGLRYEPHPWIDPDGKLFYDIVFNKETKEQRPITSTEKRIVTYCANPWRRDYNIASENLGRARAECQPYIEQDLRSAAKGIYDHWKSKEKVSKEATTLLKYINPDGSYIEALPKKKKVAN